MIHTACDHCLSSHNIYGSDKEKEREREKKDCAEKNNNTEYMKGTESLKKPDKYIKRRLNREKRANA